MDLGMGKFSDIAFIAEKDLQTIGFNSEEIVKIMSKVTAVILFEQAEYFRWLRDG